MCVLAASASTLAPRLFERRQRNEEATSQVAVEPLHLTLGLGAVRPTSLAADQVVEDSVLALYRLASSIAS